MLPGLSSNRDSLQLLNSSLTYSLSCRTGTLDALLRLPRKVLRFAPRHPLAPGGTPSQRVAPLNSNVARGCLKKAEFEAQDF